MTMSRRDLFEMAGLGTLAAVAPYLKIGQAMAQASSAAGASAHDRFSAIPDLVLHGDEQIGMLIYPGFTALDLVGPHYMFASMLGATVHLVTTQSSLAPVASDLKLAIEPTVTIDDCPSDLDVIFTPGGTMGTLAAMSDARVIGFLKDRAARAQHVTSVCTGALLLGKAGLLQGKRATTHWAVHEVLREFGATPMAERVVVDGNVTTGAGVSAGLDFGLTLLGRIRGANYARAIQLQCEYAPAPPFAAGTYDSAPPDVAALMRDMLTPFADLARAAARA